MMIMRQECFIPTDRLPGERNYSHSQRRIRSRVHVANDTKRCSQSNQTTTRATAVTKRSYIRQFLILSSIGFVTFRTALSFPAGAGGCQGDQAAVGGSHLSPLKVNVTGELFEADILMYLQGEELDSSITLTFPTNTDLQIGILKTTDAYLGFLIRLEVPDTTPPIDTSSALLPTDGSSNPQTKTADNICVAPVVGITHRNPSIKTETTGILNIPEEVDNVILDVTVVLLNSPDVSAYVYSRFLVNFRSNGTVASTPTTTTSTASTSTNQPTITTSTIQPTITSSIPTLLPSSRTTLPTEIPSTSKTMPSVLPTTSTVIASEPPTRTLSSEPTSEPVASPSKVPINIPSRSPLVPKTRIPTITIPFTRSQMPSSTPTDDSPSNILASAEPTIFDFSSKKTKGSGKGMMMSEGKGMMMMSEGKGMMTMNEGKGMMMMSGIGRSASGKSGSKEKKNAKSKGKYNRGKESSKLPKYGKTSKEEGISSKVENDLLVDSKKKSNTIVKTRTNRTSLDFPERGIDMPKSSKTSKEGKTRTNRTSLDLPELEIDIDKLPEVTDFGPTVAPSNYNSDKNTEDNTNDSTFADSTKSRNAATAPPSSREEGKALTVKIDHLLNFEIKTRPHRTILYLPEREIDILPTIEPSIDYSGNNADDKTNDNKFAESEKTRNEATVPPSDGESVDTTDNMDSSYDKDAQYIKELIESPFDNVIQIRQRYDYQQTGVHDTTRTSTRTNEDETSLNYVHSVLAELWSDKSNIFGNTLSTGRVRSSGNK